MPGNCLGIGDTVMSKNRDGLYLTGGFLILMNKHKAISLPESSDNDLLSCKIYGLFLNENMLVQFIKKS